MRKPPRAIFVVINFLVAGLCFFGDTTGLIEYQDNPEPLKISLADYLKTQPPNGWVELSDCTIVYSRAVGYRKWFDKAVTEAEIPVYPPGRTDGPVALILHASEVEKSAVPGRPDETHATLSGMVRSRGLLYSGFDKKLESVGAWTLADHYTILHQDEAPSLPMVIGTLVIGLILLVSALRGTSAIYRRTAEAQAADEPAQPSFPDPAATLAQFRQIASEQELTSKT